MQKVTFILTLLLITGISNAEAQTSDVITISSLKLTEEKTPYEYQMAQAALNLLNVEIHFPT